MPRHRYLCAMRWSDMDAQGHINNTAFFAYLEQARVDLFFEYARRSGVTTIAEGIVVARHEIDYKRPVSYRPEPLAVDLWCSRIGGASFAVDYEIYVDDAAPVVLAKTMCVAFDLPAGRARRLNDTEREFLQRWLEPGGD